ncbi:ralA-binding protein 1 [Chrysoperla carnea]|uniref:ralA-binding protein 1 n=1 Tax=Chrysoperla carnea TaxID=189513 RepID=UPI001D06BD96|nr:ralA-binding protein 1 [Chrysoperla carnea]
MDLNYDNSESDQSTFSRLYAYDTGKKSNESDLSGDESGKLSKKDLLIGKRKDKDSKKDRGYAALEGESSPEETESKSPLKSKKTKSFKFASKNKEKREKSREKDNKDKDKDSIDKKKEKDKEKKNEKNKEKPKSDKKEKRKNEGLDIEEEQPIFGVSLDLAVERSRCHDGVQLPLPIRESIDYLEEYGMVFENLYKISSVKSKVQQVRQLYNTRHKVNWLDFDVTTATGLIKSFIRDLPSPILTNELLPKFEEASANSSEIEMQNLISQLPLCNQTLLSWLMVHLHNVISHEKHTKMNFQCMAVTLSPVLLMSQRLITMLLVHSKLIFTETVITKYKPPLNSTAVNLLNDANDIALELKKQESLLSQIHHDMHAGFVTKDREEQLWDVQRIITQLKRKLRSVQKCQDTSHNHENNVDDTNSIDVKIETIEATVEINNVPQQEPSVDNVDSTVVEAEPKPVEESAVQTVPQPIVESQIIRPTMSDDDKNILLLQFQNSELIELQTYLLTQIQIEKNEIGQLKKQLIVDDHPDTTAQNTTQIIDNDHLDWDQVIDLLMKENQILNIKKNTLIRELMEQREECVNLQSQLLFIALSQG